MTQEPLSFVSSLSRPPTVDKPALTGHTDLTEKDVLLKELQHRVKNNLQMITALIRMEARNAQHPDESARFNQLAGRVDALTILYRSLSDANADETVDLGTYEQIASGSRWPYAVRYSA